MAISRKGVGLIIILLFIILLSIIWVWYEVQLREIETKKKTLIPGISGNQKRVTNTTGTFNSSPVHIII